jgi:hypothetical protein
VNRPSGHGPLGPQLVDWWWEDRVPTLEQQAAMHRPQRPGLWARLVAWWRHVPGEATGPKWGDPDYPYSDIADKVRFAAPPAPSERSRSNPLGGAFMQAYKARALAEVERSSKLLEQIGAERQQAEASSQAQRSAAASALAVQLDMHRSQLDMNALAAAGSGSSGAYANAIRGILHSNASAALHGLAFAREFPTQCAAPPPGHIRADDGSVGEVRRVERPRGGQLAEWSDDDGNVLRRVPRFPDKLPR